MSLLLHLCRWIFHGTEEHLPIMRQFFSVLLGFAWIVSAAFGADSLWLAGEGSWQEGNRWHGRAPDDRTIAWVRGQSALVLPKSPQVVAVGALRLGTLPGDAVRLRLQGGALVSRRELVHIGEADGSEAAVELDDGALHGVAAVYLGGAGNDNPAGCRASLTIRGGSFVCRLLTVGWGQNSEATLTVEGSRASAVHALDGVSVGVPIAGWRGSTCTLRFTLDAQGVTPLTIQSRRGGLRIERKARSNRCRLRINLMAVPPRDDVTLVSAQAATQGAFDDLPEGAAVTATYEGREYSWTLTYRGGESGHDIVLTNPRGHAPGAPATKCRPVPATPVPLWETMPLRQTPDVVDAPPGFDGAEGFGRHASGGRGGQILAVENLADAGPGSFRAAVTAKGPRVVQFRVSGEIALKSNVGITEPFLTVDGESAPADGITLTGGGLLVSTHDVILRHFRVRPGDTTEGTDALSFYDAQRCIADHLSLGWGTDEVVSITGLSDEITVQWCLVHEGINRVRHGFASISGGERVTWHHNLLAHHVSRVPRFAGIAHADFRNNLLYNWGHTAGYGQFERLNYVANYLKPGPSTTQRPLRFHRGDEVVGDGSLFLDGNVLHNEDAVTQENWQGVGFEPSVRASRPFPTPPVTTQSAVSAFDSVLRYAGALPHRRDVTDTRVVREVRDGTGRIINHVRELTP
ncbi:MAG: polysaccharide lyase family 1 protein [Pirellulaceae bacterium]